jgi:hypothetical protein
MGEPGWIVGSDKRSSVRGVPDMHRITQKGRFARCAGERTNGTGTGKDSPVPAAVG